MRAPGLGEAALEALGRRREERGPSLHPSALGTGIGKAWLTWYGLRFTLREESDSFLPGKAVTQLTLSQSYSRSAVERVSLSL